MQGRCTRQGSPCMAGRRSARSDWTSARYLLEAGRVAVGLLIRDAPRGTRSQDACPGDRDFQVHDCQAALGGVAILLPKALLPNAATARSFAECTGESFAFRPASTDTPRTHIYIYTGRIWTDYESTLSTQRELHAQLFVRFLGHGPRTDSPELPMTDHTIGSALVKTDE
jgi:hypothetical protein